MSAMALGAKLAREVNEESLDEVGGIIHRRVLQHAYAD